MATDVRGNVHISRQPFSMCSIRFCYGMQRTNYTIAMMTSGSVRDECPAYFTDVWLCAYTSRHMSVITGRSCQAALCSPR